MSKKTQKKSPAKKSGQASVKKTSTGKTATARKSPAKSAKTAQPRQPRRLLRRPVPKERFGREAETGGRSPSSPRPGAKNGDAQAGLNCSSFFLPRDGGQFVSLASFAGRKLVIFFYPRADTPGCTKEAMDFSRLASAFAACQTAVLGVSADPLKKQESFRDKHQLTVPLVSDEKQLMLKKYGAWGEKSMYGKSFTGVLRSTVLVDAGGKIARVWTNVKVDGHAEDVLTAARML